MTYTVFHPYAIERSYPPFGEYDGQLRVTRQTSSIISGTITPESITTQVFSFGASDLALLKEMLKDFDSRLMKWKNNPQDRKTGFPYKCLESENTEGRK